MRLYDTVLPALDPPQRTFVRTLSRRIEQDKIFDEALLRDLDAFTAFLRQLVVDGTTTAWEVDESDVHGGYEILCLDDRAKALKPVAGELQELWTEVAATLDATKADAAALQLVSE
tara:strand:- start:10377 stop:10724 length:348 start_codon:yes stop_codon:yes gene_type:complete